MSATRTDRYHWYKGAKFLGLPIFWGDFAGMALFMLAAFVCGCSWLSPLIGVAFWRVISE